jgi:hypothetical protein
LRPNKRKKTSKGRRKLGRKERARAALPLAIDLRHGRKEIKSTEGGKKDRATLSIDLGRLSLLPAALPTLARPPALRCAVPTIARRPTSSHNHDAGLIREACDDLATTVLLVRSEIPNRALGEIRDHQLHASACGEIRYPCSLPFFFMMHLNHGP